MSWGLPSVRHCSVAGRNTPRLRWSQPKWSSSKLLLFNHRLVPSSTRVPFKARAATTVASPSHVDASPAADWSTRETENPRAIPPRFGPLHEALAAVRDAAASDTTNLARLQLAQRGLETETPIIRVAVFALECKAAGVFEFVGLLLADPLSAREDWERYLQAAQIDLSQGLLIRYGEDIRLNSGNTPVPIMTIPSRTLKKGNLEFLVASGDDVGSINDLLVPKLATQMGSNDLYPGAHYQYPVHKTVVLGEGIDGIVAYSSKVGPADVLKCASTIHGAFRSKIGIPSRNAAQAPSNAKISLVDIEEASDALNQIRNSVHNASAYERGWTGSGLQYIADWLSTPAASHPHQLHPAIRDLIASSFDQSAESIKREKARAVQTAATQSVSEQVREDLNDAVDSWAQRAHTELQDKLTEAFASASWRKLVWWKLFWRVDDVSVVTEEILRDCWLTRSEKETLWLGGRLRQAKLLDSDPGQSGEVKQDQSNEESELQRTHQLSTPPPPPDEPGQIILPLRIARERSNLSQTRAPALQALGQKLVLFSLSTTTLTAALSAVSYISMPDITLYEAGSLTAVAVLICLRRQQKQWNKARESLERDVHEKGREVLDETESLMRSAIRNGGRVHANTDIHGAMKNIEIARKALRDVN